MNLILDGLSILDIFYKLQRKIKQINLVKGPLSDTIAGDAQVEMTQLSVPLNPVYSSNMQSGRCLAPPFMSEGQFMSH